MARHPQNEARDEAADWVTKIHSGEVDQYSSAEFRAWLDSSAEHRRVFQRMSDVFSRTDALSNAYEAGSSLPPVRYGGFRFAAAASVLLAIAAGFWTFSGSALRLETQTGERFLTSVEDGSSLHLNAQSAVELEFTEDARLATMSGGEILFSVNSDDPRPFIVHTDNVDVEVTGTSFQVTHYGVDTVVSVLEGSVLVRPARNDEDPDRGRGLEVRMRTGEQVAWQDGALGSPVSVDTSRVAAWRDGWLFLDDQPLKELIDRLDRQYDESIEIQNDELAESRISVAVKFGREEETFARLERLLPVDFEELPGNRRIVHARRR